MGIFTELSILYSKYRPEKREFPWYALTPAEAETLGLVMEHLKLFVSRVNIPKVPSTHYHIVLL